MPSHENEAVPTQANGDDATNEGQVPASNHVHGTVNGTAQDNSDIELGVPVDVEHVAKKKKKKSKSRPKSKRGLVSQTSPLAVFSY